VLCFWRRWNRWCRGPSCADLIEPHYPKAGNGRPPVGLERMLRVYFLQQWHATDFAAKGIAGFSTATLEDRWILSPFNRVAVNLGQARGAVGSGRPSLLPCRLACDTLSDRCDYKVGIIAMSIQERLNLSSVVVQFRRSL
jgi:hypothetical protein